VEGSERAGWIQAVKDAVAGQTSSLKCPHCGNHTLDAEWHPFVLDRGGEYRLRCRTCGAENYALKRRPKVEE
jgi:uncharacterized C2H2 Zn-finger protein